MANLLFMGYVFGGDGEPMEGVTVNLSDRGTRVPVRAVTVTEENGFWWIAYYPKGEHKAEEWDIRLISGSWEVVRHGEEAVACGGEGMGVEFS